jgi:hypothetical protein
MRTSTCCRRNSCRAAINNEELDELSLFEVVQVDELCAQVCVGVVGNDGLVSRVLGDGERYTVGEMEIALVTNGDVRVPKLRRELSQTTPVQSHQPGLVHRTQP